MNDILPLNKGQYLGNVISISESDDFVASALTAEPLEMSNDALHYHVNPIISFVLEGMSIEKISRHINHRFAGDSRFYRAGELHQVKIKRFPSRNTNFELKSNFLTQFGISEESIGLAMDKNVNIKPIFLRMYKELLIADTFTGNSIRMMLLNLIGKEKEFLNDKKPHWITALYELLNDRWNEPLTLQDLSLALKVHPVTISKGFTRFFSCTLGEYLRKLRIGKSISLIKNSKLSLTEIAFACGFADHSHFTRNFKELTGYLPREFKKL